MDSVPEIRLPGSPLARAYGSTDAAGVPIEDRNSALGAVAAMKAAMRVGAVSNVLKAAADAAKPPPSAAEVGQLGLAVQKATDPGERAVAAERLAHLQLTTLIAKGGLGRRVPSAAEQLSDARTAITKATTPEGKREAALVAIMKAATSLPPGVPATDGVFRPTGNVTMGTTMTLDEILHDICGDSSSEADPDLDDDGTPIAYADRPTGVPRVDPKRLPSSDGVRAHGLSRLTPTLSDDRSVHPAVLDSRSGPIAKAARTGRKIEAAKALADVAEKFLKAAASIEEDGRVAKASGSATTAPLRPRTAPRRSVTVPVTVQVG